MSAIAVMAEQRRLKEVVREFVKRVVVPVAAELDQRPNPRECFSWQIVEEASKVGLRTLTLDEEYGGAGADSLTTAVVIEELASGDVGGGHLRPDAEDRSDPPEGVHESAEGQVPAGIQK